MNQIIDPKNLTEAEQQLLILLAKDRKDWIRIARILLIIERERFYEDRFQSFTRYVHYLAAENRVNVSTFWRAKTAATVYMGLAGITAIEQLVPGKIKATPEQYELFKRVQTIAPEKIIGELRQKLLAGENIRNQLRQLWLTYRPLKKGKTERGRQKQKQRLEAEQRVLQTASQFQLPYTVEEDKVNKDIAGQRYYFILKDLEKLERYNLSTEELSMANVKNALRSREWAGQIFRNPHIYRFNLFQDVVIRPGNRQKPVKFDALAAIKPEKQRKKPVLLVGVRIILNVHSLDRQLYRLKELWPFCHYCFVAVPQKDELVNLAIARTSEFTGILAIGEEVNADKHSISMVKNAIARTPDAAQLLPGYQSLLEMSMDW